LRKCCSRLLDVAFGNLNLKAVTIGTATINDRARSLAVRLGFELEKFVPEALERSGRRWDGVKYQLTAERWKQSK
jgi:RimJ/RimL family protein N-acetyltransferase